MPPDHIFTWERPPFGRDRFDRFECDQGGPVRKDWPLERPYQRSSSSLVLPNGSLPGPSSKRRAAGFAGRQDLVVENGRCEGGLDRHSQTSSPRCPSSSPSFSSGKSQREPGNFPGQAACNGSPKGGRISRVTEGLYQLKESHLSPFTEGRHLASPRPVSGLPLRQSYGSAIVSDGLDMRDRARAKPGDPPGWDAPCKDHSDRNTGCSKVECTQKRISAFPKLVIADWQAEGRLDRYGSTSSKEHSATDVLNSAREPSWHDWRFRDKPISSSFSPHTSPYSFSSSIGRDSTSFLHNQHVQLGRSPSQDSTLCSAAQNDTSPIDSGPSSAMKRPRLTWGQGLAKYEKEKTEEEPCFSEIAREDAHRDLASAVEYQISSLGDACAVSRQDSSYPVELHTPTSGITKVIPQDGSAMQVCGSPTETCDGSEVTRVDGLDQQDILDRPSAAVLGSCRECTTSFHDPSGVRGAQCFLGSHSSDALSMPKHWLMQQVEKLELQIDLVEKEIINLGNGTEVTVVHSTTEDTQTSRDEGPGLPVNCGMEWTDRVNLHEHYVVCPFLNSLKEDLTMGTVAMDHDDGLSKSGEATHGPVSKQWDKMITEHVVLDESILLDCSPNTIQQSKHRLPMALESSILQANKELAIQSSAALSHLLHGVLGINTPFVNDKLYGCPIEAPTWACNSVSHESKQKLLELKLVEENHWQRLKERVLALKSSLLRKQAGYHNRAEESKAPRERAGNPFREYLRMPSMLLEVKERESSRFVTSNALVENPIAVEEERKHVNPWSKEEKNIFLEKYSVLGKSFNKIASFLPHKTIADCVEYYYRNQKSEEFVKVHHRHHLKKRRDQVRSSASFLSTTTSASSRRRESNSNTTEGLTLIAAAAMAVQRDISRDVRSSIPSSLDDIPTTKVLRDRTLVTQRCNLASSRSSNDNCAEARGGRRVLVNNVKSPKVDIEQQWTELERELFTAAVSQFGKDFNRVSSLVGSRSQGQCKAFFKKMHKCLGLDESVQQFKSAREGSLDCGEERPVSEDIKPLLKMEEVYVVADGQETMAHEVDALTLPSDQTSAFVSGLDETRVEESCMDTHMVNKLESLVEGQGMRPACEVDQVSRNLTVVTLPVAVDVSASLPDSYNDVERQVSSVVTDGGCLNSFQSITQVTGDAAQSSFEVANSTCMKAVQFKTVSESMEYTDSYSTVVPDTPSGAVQDNLSPCELLPDALGAIALTMAHVGDAKSTGLDAKSRREPTTWTHEEKEKFMDILRNHGKDWDRLCQSLPAKSLTHIKTFFQNSKAKLGLFSEGIGCNSGRGGVSRKRKAEDSELIVNGSGAEFSASKGLNVTGRLGTNVVTDESYGLDALVGRTPLLPQVEIQLESLGTNKSSQPMGVLPNLGASGVFPTVSAAISSNLKQQSYIHHPALPAELANLQTSSHSLVPQVLQQSSLTLGHHQENQRQQQQPHQQLIVQHLSKQSTQLQPLHQQVVDVVLHQQLQLQLAQWQDQLKQQQQTQQPPVQDVSQHFQAMGHHQVQAHHPLILPVVSQQLQGSCQVASLLRACSGQYKPASISQLPVGLFQSQPKQPRSHAPSHQQIPQHQPQIQLQIQQQQQQQQQFQQQLQLQQQQQLQMQQQKMLLQLHQAQVQQLQAKILGNSRLQRNAAYLHEQLQLAPTRGITQLSESTPSEVAMYSDTSVLTNSRFRDAASDGVQESRGVSQRSQVTAKSQCSSDAELRGADVKLFGQSLLSQPACSAKQMHGCALSSSSSPGPITAASLSSITTKTSSDHLSELHGVAGDHPFQVNGWQHSTNNAYGWPSSTFGSILDEKKGPGLVGGEAEDDTAQATRRGAREESSLLSHSTLMMQGAQTSPDVFSSNASHGLNSDIRRRVVEREEISVLSQSTQSMQCGRSLSEVLSSKVEHVYGMEQASSSKEVKSSVQGVLLNQGREFSFPSVKNTSELQAPPGLPRVLDALVALAEWRLQNATGSTNKITEEFLSHSWEALQRDPGSLVEAGKASASRSQGGLETLQQLRESILKYQPHLTQFHSSVGGAGNWRSNVHDP